MSCRGPRDLALAATLATALAACAQAESSVDATTDGPPADAGADAPTDAPGSDGRPAGNDVCAGAEDVTTAAHGATGATITGDLTGYHNDVQPPTACTGFTNDGPDAVYVVTMGPGKTITATLDPQGWDGAVEIVQPCVLTPICLAGSDGASPEVASYTSTAATTVYVVVDSWSDTAFGPYTLNVTVQ
ncbi:MAG: hypothetical protein IPL61_38655 [Myxococcales bacterium]|nr:hypothetical protein [Myxococcales bacterium]